jgi:signal transduction histidine kinase/Tfp pilus assembly protein PilF
MFNRNIIIFYKLIFRFTILALLFIYPLSLLSENSEIGSDAVNIKKQIKLIDSNIEFIKQNYRINSDSSLALALQTLDLAKKDNYLTGINNCYKNIALIYKINNNTDSAIHYYNKGLEYDFRDKDLLADFLWNLAELYRATGNLSMALEESLALRTLVESKQTKKYSYQVYNLLALCYQGIMEYDLAFENYSRSAELALINKNEAFAGVIYANIGKLFYDQNNLNHALEYFEKGIKLEKKYELYDNLGNSFNVIAGIYLKLNNPDSTAHYLYLAKSNNIKSDNQRGLAKTYYEYSKVHLENSKVDSAIFYLNKAIDLASMLNSNILLKDAYHDISDIYFKKEDYKKAYEYHHLFFEIHNKIFDVKKISKAKAIEYKLIRQENETKTVELKLKKQKIVNIHLYVFFTLFVIVGAIVVKYLFLFKKLNKELILSKNKAEESDVLKSEFLKTISHEIRTPLNGIIGFTEMIISNKRSDDELKDIQGYLLKSSQDLTSTIENIVEMAHISSKQYHVKKTNLKVSSLFNKIANQVNDGFLFDHKKDIVIDIDLNNKIGFYSDVHILRKTILQLIKNALKYTEKGKIRVGCYKEKTKIIFYVEDTGIGIGKEKLDIIFSPFRQLGNKTNINTGGIGLGLTIVKEFVLMLNGEIRVDSELGKGSTFFISLPNK